MRYLCMIYTDSANPVSLSDKDQEDLIAEHLAYDEELVQSGHWIIAHSLQPDQTATTVKVRSGEISVSDGPFLETKEQFTGFFLIEAKDLNDAIGVASRIPSARYGAVEIRPIRVLRV